MQWGRHLPDCKIFSTPVECRTLALIALQLYGSTIGQYQVRQLGASRYAISVHKQTEWGKIKNTQHDLNRQLSKFIKGGTNYHSTI